MLVTPSSHGSSGKPMWTWVHQLLLKLYWNTDTKFFFLSNHHIKSKPANALIRPSIQTGHLHVFCATMKEDFFCSIEPDTSTLSKVEVEMHKSKAQPWAYDMGEAAETWFTKACGLPTKLVYLPKESHRSVLGNAAGNFNAENGITFADCAQYLIANASSLAALQNMLEEDKFDIKPLRPNIVIDALSSSSSNLKPWEEDFWAGLKVGKAAHFELTANCARCASIDIE